MIPDSAASIVFPLQAAAGVLLIAVAVPLARRRVPPNPFYGVRSSSTLGDEQMWYDINALAGRQFIWIALAYLAAVGVAFAFGRAWPTLLRLLGPVVFLVVALLVEAARLVKVSSRLDQRVGSTHLSEL